jgi:hypothetical protein
MKSSCLPSSLPLSVVGLCALLACDGGTDLCSGVLCDDQNACTEDRCDAATGRCVYPPVSEGTECDFAGLPGICQEGFCTDANLCAGVDCDDQNDCTDERCVAATGLCERTNRPDGTACSEGGCEDGVCTSEFACSKDGILNAIAAGGGPYTFACSGPTTVTIGQTLIDNDVTLDGETDLTVEGTFIVTAEVVAELRRLTITEGWGGSWNDLAAGGGIFNAGTLTATSCTLTRNHGDAGGAIFNDEGILTLIDSTVSWNIDAATGGALYNNKGTVTMTNSTLSNNDAGFGGAFYTDKGSVALTHCTIARGFLANRIANDGGIVTMQGTLLQGTCTLDSVTSGGNNIESPGNTCGLDPLADQSNVSEAALNLGPLQNNGGPTLTQAPEPPSVAIDVIDPENCADADSQPLTTDQRGVTRPQGPRCDVGAVEVIADGGP